MQKFAALLLRCFILGLQSLPLKAVARIGRFGGAIAWACKVPHRRIATESLQAAFPDKSTAEITAIARENLLRIGENYASALKTSSMTTSEVAAICPIEGMEKLPSFTGPNAPKNCVFAIGHFGNFELNANLSSLIPGLHGATTYRGLDQPAFNEVLTTLRNKSGCRFYERRTESRQLMADMSRGGLVLGLLSDQHGGKNGVWSPFFGRICSTTPAPAVFALRYDAPLFTAICYRTSLARWKIEIGDPIPTHQNGRPREVRDIVQDINATFETAVRRDPANWFWVHKRWKKPPARLTASPQGAQ